MTKITLAVCNVYKNGGRFVSHRKKTKKGYKHYFITDEELEDKWKFGTEWVDSVKAQFLKLKIWHLRKFICTNCTEVFSAYVKMIE